MNEQDILKALTPQKYWYWGGYYFSLFATVVNTLSGGKHYQFHIGVMNTLFMFSICKENKKRLREVK